MRHDYRMSEMDLGGGATPVLRGRFLYNEPMKKHVSWRAGGAAQRVYIPGRPGRPDLAGALGTEREDIHMVGLGSNLLVRDGGVAGVVILLHGVLKKLAIESRTHGLPPAPGGYRHGRWCMPQAGVASPKLARFAANHDLVGAEFWAGIPGTVGGAIAMNAGCYGSETWDRLVQVQTLDRQGQLNERLPDEYVDRLSPCGPEACAAGMVHRRLVPSRPRRRRGGTRDDQGAAEKTHRVAAAEPAQRRFGVPQSARRLRGAADRVLRAQGVSASAVRRYRTSTPISSSMWATRRRPTSSA